MKKEVEERKEKITSLPGDDTVQSLSPWKIETGNAQKTRKQKKTKEKEVSSRRQECGKGKKRWIVFRIPFIDFVFISVHLILFEI